MSEMKQTDCELLQKKKKMEMPKTLVLEENHMTNKQLKQTLMTQETMNIISLI